MAKLVATLSFNLLLLYFMLCLISPQRTLSSSGHSLHKLKVFNQLLQRIVDSKRYNGSQENASGSKLVSHFKYLVKEISGEPLTCFQ